jgi:hypothetical protein
MTDRHDTRHVASAPPGLCGGCRHAHRVSTRGGVYHRCTRSLAEPAYIRYPKLPMLSCPGFERLPEAG